MPAGMSIKADDVLVSVSENAVAASTSYKQKLLCKLNQILSWRHLLQHYQHLKIALSLD